MDRKNALGSNPLSEDEKIMRDFYNPTNPNKQVNNITSKHGYKRQTYHILEDQIKKIKAYAFYNEMQVSEVVRAAVDEFLKDFDVTRPR